MKIINPNAPGRFQGAVEWFRINTPEDRFNLIGEPGEILLCESNSQQWKWDTASASWIPATAATSLDGTITLPGAPGAPNLGLSRETWYQNVFPDNQLTGWSAPATRSILLRIPAPAPFTAFRLRVPSGGGDTIQFSCAVSGEELNNGASWTWKQISIGGSTNPYTRSAAGHIWTDWMFMPSVPRNDESKRPYLFIRCYGAALVYKAFSVQAAVCEKQYGVYGADALAYTDTGDNRLTSLGMAPTYGTSVKVNILGVEYAPADSVRCYTIGQVGDSLDQGWNRTTADLQWQPTAHEAARSLISRGYRAIDFSLAKAGQSQLISATTDIDTMLGAFVPDFLMINPWSPNDTNSDAAFSACLGATSDLLKRCRAAGVTPIVKTITPFAFTGDNEIRRNRYNSMIRSLRGCIIADTDAAVRDPSNPSALLPAYKDPANIDSHLSRAGYVACGVSVADALVAAGAVGRPAS